MKKVKFIIFLSTLVMFQLWGNAQYFFSEDEIQGFIQENHLECPENSSNEMTEIYVEWLSRVELRKKPNISKAELLELNSIFQFAGRNKCNPDYEYKPELEGLNPLMFHLFFESKEEIMYRIGNSKQVLVIHPKK